MDKMKDIVTKKIPEVTSYKSYESGFREKHLTTDGFDRFVEEVEALLSSIDSDVKNNVQEAVKIASAIDTKTSDPAIRTQDWSNNLWYQLFKDQQTVVDRFVTASMYKTWMIKFLSITADKLYELVTSIKSRISEIEKIKAERDLFDKMQQSLDTERKRYHAVTQEQIYLLNDEINEVKDAINKLVLQVELMSQKVDFEKNLKIDLDEIKQSKKDLRKEVKQDGEEQNEKEKTNVREEESEEIDEPETKEDNDSDNLDDIDVDDFDDMIEDL